MLNMHIKITFLFVMKKAVLNVHSECHAVLLLCGCFVLVCCEDKMYTAVDAVVCVFCCGENSLGCDLIMFVEKTVFAHFRQFLKEASVKESYTEL